MRVDTGASHLFPAQPTAAPKGSSAEGFGAMLTAEAAPTNGAPAYRGEGQKPDFTNMTRQDLFDWMNGQILDGKMSLEESTPFLAMTVKYSAAAGEMADMASDKTRIDFTEKARQGIEFCRSHFDYDGAEGLERALAIMRGV